MSKNGKETIREEEVVTAAEAAVIKGVTRRAVYDAIRDGRLIARRSNGIWLIRRTDLDAWEVVGHRPRAKPEDMTEQ
jgi:excisionase family DNA binding protein